MVSGLLSWHQLVHRPMPWKGEKNPYLIWLSEIIMQQTRVEQGLPYYVAFKEKYPTITALANAPEDEVMRLWKGLGYYSRARNLHHAAKTVRDSFKGNFPQQYEEILSLKGVGAYTAAAIASFAYNEQYAVVDGNVYRVLSRFFGIDTPIDNHAAKKQFADIAAKLIQISNKPAAFNQAIMDFGALQCSPARPDCETCPLQQHCFAAKHQMTDVFPVKEKKIAIRERFFHYLFIHHDEHIFIRKRTHNDIWKNLYELPMIESKSLLSWQSLKRNVDYKNFFGNTKFALRDLPVQTSQKLTHRKINAIFFDVEIRDILPENNYGCIRAHTDSLNNFAFPKTIDWYIQNKHLYLNLNSKA